MKKILSIFFCAFVLNAVWENLHSLLYANYEGGSITEFILLRATLADAVMITLVALPFLLSPELKNKSWFIVIFGFIISISNELYALSTNRWAYNSLMPIIPFLGVGLTPTIQLGLTGYISFKLQNYFTQLLFIRFHSFFS